MRLTDSIIRGEGVVLRAEDVQPVDLVWENGLLVTSEWLVVADGGERLPLPAETIRISEVSKGGRRHATDCAS